MGCTDTCRDAVRRATLPLAARYHDTKGTLLSLQLAPSAVFSINMRVALQRLFLRLEFLQTGRCLPVPYLVQLCEIRKFNE